MSRGGGERRGESVDEDISDVELYKLEKEEVEEVVWGSVGKRASDRHLRSVITIELNCIAWAQSRKCPSNTP